MHGRLLRVQVGGEIRVVSARRQLRWLGQAPAGARLVVGDRVLVEGSGSDSVVVAAEERTTSLVRRAPRSGRVQVIAANVDQALLVFAARRPDPNPALLDRFLVACSRAGIEPVITINKQDLGCDLVEQWLPTYRDLGYPILCLSAREQRGLDQLRQRLAGATTLFCGPSGVGKSSLLNAVAPGLELRVGAVSEVTGKGLHTTSRAELLPLPFGGLVVDSPGLKEFAMWDLTRESLQDSFPEIRAHSGQCYYAGCSHSHEPDCAVAEAVAAGTIAPARHASYLTLLSET